MNNFSAKNAEFETVTINNEAAITSANIGTDPNKIPLNKDLGSLAYQDAVNLDDVSADMLELRAIAAEISDSAVDVFVYDTSRDSDGGAWRKRTQHTSWYNEELNTATRGARRGFPAVAVIVAEAGKVTIYDGDDPDLSMWMVFNASGGRMIWATQLSCVSSLNAKISIGSPASGFRYIDFVSENMREWRMNGVNSISGNISERNNGSLTLIDVPGQDVIVNQIINDVSMTVLPNAPIDEDTGLPVPTIAVATDGGVSVIKDDGTVVDIICGQTSFVYSYHVIFDQSNRLFLSIDGQDNSRRVWGLNNIPATDLVVSTDANSKQNGDIFIADDNGFGSGKDMFLFNESNPHATEFAPDNSIGTNKNLFKSFINKEDSSKSLYNYITSKYNTGWMPGDIKLATLSDTTVETIGTDGSNLLGGNNSSFTSGVGDWVDISIGSGSVVYNTGGRYVELARTDANNNARIAIGLNLQAGQMYFLRFSLVDSGTSGVQVKGFKSSDNSFSANQIINSTASQDGTYTVSFRAEDGYDGIMFIPISGTNTVANLDSVSIRATTELITNGDFSNGTTGWAGLSGGVLSIDDGRLKIEETASAVDAYAVNSSVISTVVGQRYLITWQFIKGTNTGFSTRFGKSGDQSLDYKGNTSGEYTDDGYYSFEFTSTGTELNLSFIVNDVNSYGFLDDISVRPVVDDRSVNNNDLQIIGEINKTPVAPGADLVAYSGFSENNYLVQPYNEDLNFGTGDFCVMGWVKPNFNSVDGIFARGTEGSTDNFIYLGTNSNGAIATFIDNANGTTTSTLEENVWSFIVFGRTSNTSFLYVNGNKDDLSYSSIEDISSTTAITRLGNTTYSLSAPNGGSLALWRVTATAPTDAQIAKIYRDEKVLFQDGAQATLHGTSDAVTALAYDDKTELLHVGTSSGRSDFSGLRRINNTTTAITTSISAHNNLIAEQ